MTEAELVTAAQETWANYLTSLGLFIGIVSAYLVVAYAVGKDLSRAQVVHVNVLFVIFTGFGLVGMYNWSRVAGEMAMIAIEMSEVRQISPTTGVPTLSLVVLIPIVIACLKFMWDVRHPKTEQPLTKAGVSNS